MAPAKPDKVDLSGRGLKSISPAIWGKTSLRVLNLFRNDLKRLPAEIGNLKELRVLIIANNQLCTLPEEIGSLPNCKCWTQDTTCSPLCRNLSPSSTVSPIICTCTITVCKF